MYNANAKRRWTPNKPILTQTTAYALKSSNVGESRLSEMQQSAYAKEKKDTFIRLYRKGKRSFSKADLYGVDLQGVRLEHIRLVMADLRRADLRGADLRGAKLRGADLREADLRGADLRGANLQDADLTGAKLAGAKLDDVTQINPTWRLIWETVNHGGNGHKPDN